MRDKNRIDLFCQRLALVWKACPDLRFGQLMMNVFDTTDMDPFYIEDDAMINRIEEFGQNQIRFRNKGKRLMR